MKESFPSIKRVGVLANGNNPPGLAQGGQESDSLRAALNLELVLVLVNGAKEILAGDFSPMVQEGVDGLTLLTDAEFDSARQEIVTLAAQTRLPAMFEHRAFVEAGGLMSYGPKRKVGDKPRPRNPSTASRSR